MKRAALMAIASAFAASGMAQSVLYTNLQTGWMPTGDVLQSPTGAGAGTSTITRLFADDIDFGVVNAGAAISSLKFTVLNNNNDGQTISFRARIRFYQTDGASGGPGTYITGYSISAQAWNAFTYYTDNITGVSITVPTNGKMWAAVCFDNNVTAVTGSTLATAAQMANIGEMTAAAPTIGSSLDQVWESTATDPNGFLVNNPAGSIVNFGGNPVANFGWEFTGTPVPEPASIAALGVGALALIRRRRNRKS